MVVWGWWWCGVRVEFYGIRCDYNGLMAVL